MRPRPASGLEIARRRHAPNIIAILPTRFFAAVVNAAFAAASLSSCVADRGQSVTFSQPPLSNDDYWRWFEEERISLGLYRSDGKDDIEQILLVIAPPFEPSVGVSITRDVVEEEPAPFEDYSLSATWRQPSNSGYKKLGEVSEFTTVSQRYVVDVTAADIDATATQIEKMGFTYLRRPKSRIRALLTGRYTLLRRGLTEATTASLDDRATQAFRL
ncbi:MAG: hypothetical protein AAGJ87_07200 [Pseudomonadota bacterium]